MDLYRAPCCPRKARTGRPRAYDRKTPNGILYVLTTGSRWMEYGSYKTDWRRLKERENREVWKTMWQRLVDMGYQEGRLSLEVVAVDATSVEAKREVDSHRLRKGTKVQAVVTAQGVPVRGRGEVGLEA